VDAVLGEMVRLANDYKSDPRLRDRVQQITDSVNLENPDAVAQAVWRWIRENVRYVRDPSDTELLQSPVRILEEPRYADCDGMATLGAAMLSAVGHRAGFRAIAREKSGAYDHVYAVYEPLANRRWHALDPTAPLQPGPDQQASQALSVKTVPLSDMSDSSTLAASEPSTGLTTVGSNETDDTMALSVYPPPGSGDDGQGDVTTTSEPGGATQGRENILNTIIREAGDVASSIWGNRGQGGTSPSGTRPPRQTRPTVPVRQSETTILGMSPGTLAIVGIGTVGVGLVASQFMGDDS
jgi:hypothetical protein